MAMPGFQVLVDFEHIVPDLGEIEHAGADQRVFLAEAVAAVEGCGAGVQFEGSYIKK